MSTVLETQRDWYEDGPAEFGLKAETTTCDGALALEGQARL